MDYIDLTTSNINDFDPTNENDLITSSSISFESKSSSKEKLFCAVIIPRNKQKMNKQLLID